MKKAVYRILSFVGAIVLAITSFSTVLGSYQPAPAPVYKQLSVTNSTGLSFETSGSVESITTTTNGWVTKAGGEVASSHYARAKYKLPETLGTVFTYFYVKSVIVLPSDFYTQQNSGFRILNTDNYTTTLNGVTVGAANANELRVSVYFNSDHTLRVLADHELGTKLTLYTATTILPTGQHTFELAGDVANVAPWYFKIDGVVVASGTQRLSPDDTLASERVLTRVITGIDGAADQDNNSVNLTVKNFEFANYDAAGTAPTSVPPTATLPAATATKTATASAATATKTATLPAATATKTATLPAATATKTATLPAATVTKTSIPTVISQPTNTPVPPAGTNSVDLRIKSGDDDVEESGSGGINMYNSDLELVYDGSSQVVGLRFPGIQIPQGATITNAYIQFTVDETSSGTNNLTVSGEASANASAFTRNSHNISNRPRTINKTTWSPASWVTVGDQGTAQRTSNLSSIIQEIVGQSGWASGNSLVLIVTGTTGKRVADSYEDNAAGAPLLHVEFSMPTQALAAPQVLQLQVLPAATATATAVLMPTTIPATAVVIPTNTPAPTVEAVVSTNTPIPTVEAVIQTETPATVVP